MHKVLDRLLVSSLSEANDPLFLGMHDVQSILYFGNGGMFPDDIKLYHRQVENEKQLTEEELTDGIEFLRESLRTGRRVLAVGSTGATIVAAYLAEMGFGSNQAIRMLEAGTAPKPIPSVLEKHSKELQRRSNVTVHGFAL